MKNSFMPSSWVVAHDAPFGSDPSETQADKDARTIRWEELKQRLALGAKVTGRVFIQAPFGVFFDAGLGFPVLIEFPANYPALDSMVTGKVVDFDDDNRQIRAKEVGSEIV